MLDRKRGNIKAKLVHCHNLIFQILLNKRNLLGLPCPYCWSPHASWLRLWEALLWTLIWGSAQQETCCVFSWGINLSCFVDKLWDAYPKLLCPYNCQHANVFNCIENGTKNKKKIDLCTTNQHYIQEKENLDEMQGQPPSEPDNHFFCKMSM